MDRVCRACLTRGEVNGKMINLFQYELSDDFSKIANVEITKMDGVTEFICCKCRDVLRMCKSFRIQCQKAHVTLTSLVETRGTAILPPATHTAKPALKVLTNPQETIKSLIQFIFNDDDKLTLRLAPTEDEINKEIDYQCPSKKCKFTFKKLNKLTEHYLSAHEHSKTCTSLVTEFYCPLRNCSYNVNSKRNKSFTERRLLKQHYVKVHKVKEHNCPKCGVKFSFESALHRHLKVCDQKFICTACESDYKTNEALLVHLMRKHPELHKQYKEDKLKSKQKSHSDAFVEAMEDSAIEVRDLEFFSDQTTQTQMLIPRLSDVETQTLNEKAFNMSEYLLDSSPKRTFATQTFNFKALNTNYVTNDVSLACWNSESKVNDYCLRDSPGLDGFHSKSKRSKSEDHSDLIISSVNQMNNIQTQTAFEELFGRSQGGSEDDYLTESVSLSDIQTQTAWPLDFEMSEQRKIVLNSAETQTISGKLTPTNDFNNIHYISSPDLSYKETQTCFCFLDSPKLPSNGYESKRSLFESDHSGSIKDGGLTHCASRKGDVLLSFHSTETQTCFGENKVGLDELDAEKNI